MNKPLLSICIPTYNRAGYLKNCLESLRIQVVDNTALNDVVEIIIFDNCSTDNTVEIVEGYKKYFKNFTYYVQEKNVGFDLNVLNVVENATGTYCWYLGDDDVIVNGALLYIHDCLKDFEYDVITVEARPISNSYDHKKKEEFSNAFTVEVGDCNEFYFNGYFQGGFSVLIFNREMWLSCVDINNFLKYWLYYETVAKILVATRKKMLYIKQSAVLTGQDCRWAENGTELFTFINSNILMEKMIDFGFDKQRILRDLTKNNKRILIMLLRAKGHGLKCTIENLKFIHTNLKRAGFWRLFLATLIYFIPNIIVVFVRDIKKYVLKKTH